jgi:hypothetical protein
MTTFKPQLALAGLLVGALVMPQSGALVVPQSRALVVPQSRALVVPESSAVAVRESSAAPSDIVTVSGAALQRAGTTWTPKAVQIVGLLPGYPVAHQHWGLAEVKAAKAFGADSIRFQVAQPALAAGTPSYLAEVRDAVALARGQGLAVILSMQDQGPSGEKNPLGLPNAATAKAWTTLTPLLQSDRGLVAELFNEPMPQPSTANWKLWATGGAMSGGTAVGHQQLITQLRHAGVSNVLIAEGLALGKTFKGSPALTDPLEQLAFGVHPYFGPVNGAANNNASAWQANFGDFAMTHAVVATEWNEGSAGPPSCTAQIPTQAPALVSYLHNHRIGLVGFAFDKVDTLIVDYTFKLTNYKNFTCGSGGHNGAGQLIHDAFAKPVT